MLTKDNFLKAMQNAKVSIASYSDGTRSCNLFWLPGKKRFKITVWSSEKREELSCDYCDSVDEALEIYNAKLTVVV